MVVSVSKNGFAEHAGIAVWTVALDDIPSTLWPSLEELLSTSEKEQAARFKFDSHRHQYLAAHALKRLQLSTMMPQVKPHSWRFSLGNWGKPKVSGVNALNFNLSHSQGLVACAVSRSAELGLDVEFVAPQAPMEIVSDCFTRHEQIWLENSPPSLKSSRFFRLWTLKEAVLKATGRGLSQSLQSFSFDFDPLRISILDPSLSSPAQWHFSQHTLPSYHILAVAWRSNNDNLPIEVSNIKFQKTA